MANPVGTPSHTPLPQEEPSVGAAVGAEDLEEMPEEDEVGNQSSLPAAAAQESRKGGLHTITPEQLREGNLGPAAAAAAAPRPRMCASPSSSSTGSNDNEAERDLDLLMLQDDLDEANKNLESLTKELEDIVSQLAAKERRSCEIQAIACKTEKDDEERVRLANERIGLAKERRRISTAINAQTKTVQILKLRVEKRELEILIEVNEMPQLQKDANEADIIAGTSQPLASIDERIDPEKADAAVKANADAQRRLEEINETLKELGYVSENDDEEAAGADALPKPPPLDRQFSGRPKRRVDPTTTAKASALFSPRRGAVVDGGVPPAREPTPPPSSSSPKSESQTWIQWAWSWVTWPFSLIGRFFDWWNG